MKAKSMIRIFNTLILTTAMLGAVTPALAVPPQIVEAAGRVLLKRPQWSDYRQTSVGARLNLEDSIRPDRGAKVIVLCPDQTTWRVPGGRIWGVSSGCPIPPRGSRDPGLVPGILGGINPSIPYIISPRRTLILDSQPTWRWNAVPDANRYTVRLSEPAGVIWQQEVSETEVVYSGEPPLKPGVLYSLTVEADTGTSSLDEKASGLEFVLLTDADTEKVQADIERLTHQGLTDEAEALALASFYADYTLTSDSAQAYNLTAQDLTTYSLTAKAIDILETLVAQGIQTPAVYRILGDLYWQSGLQSLAEAYYLKVIELAQEPKDLEELANAQFSLAEMHVVLGDLEETYKWLRQAKQSYAHLGAQGRIAVIEKQLDELNR